jgi:outer membrane protein OmpA-like peptidoglycan-associated protein
MDDVDKCGDKPETKNGFEDGDGCPDEVPVEVQKFSGAIPGILFQINEAKILPRSFGTLDQAVAVLAKYPDIKLEIAGHTSSEGDAEHNKKLSQDRADSVKTYLVSKGIDDKRIQTRGAGSSEPVADEKQPDGKEKNRRIEFKIIPQ